MTPLVAELNNLGLECLDPGWVQNIFDSEFLEFGDLPSEYENLVETLDLQSTFKDIMNAISEWLCSNEESSWATLSQQVEHDKILALLAYYIDHGCKNIVNKESRTNAVLAARVYYKLLSIPGYKAYHIYHSQLFVHSLGCLGFPQNMTENQASYFNEAELIHEVNLVIKELSLFALDLRAVILPLQLGPDDINFEDILSNLIDVIGGAIINKVHVDKIELANLFRLIYEIIDLLLVCGGHEPNPSALRFLFKCILPKLVASSFYSRSSGNVRASYVTYTGFLLSKYGTIALQGYIILLQHLCYTQDGLERVEVRNSRVKLVTGLMTLLPRKSFQNMVKWIIKFSGSCRITHRQLALELIAELMNNAPTEPVPNPAVNEPAAAQNTSDSGIEQSITEEGQNEAPPNAEDENSQDSQMVPLAGLEGEELEDIVAGLARRRAVRVRHGELLAALWARVHDTSSAVRARVLALLADCVQNSQPHIVKALKDLNGNSEVPRLMAVGARSVCDERAVVRKAGTILIYRMLKEPAPMPSSTDLAILVGLCRDASLLVRSTAIASLGDLVVDRPSDVVCDAFLSGPMHQLSDPENKVQDQVKTLIKQILFSRFSKYERSGSEDPIPWLFLRAITRRNMKRHLLKACIMLSASINHRIVDMLSTHLGVLNDERDLQCLVMLTCIARLVEYSNVGFVVKYYYNLVNNLEGRDARLLPLVLDLLTAWSRFIQTCESTALREHLVRRLAEDVEDGCRIYSASLATRLNTDSMTWANELMQLSERRAIETSDIEEAVRAVDLSLLAPQQPVQDLLKLFLNQLSNPNPMWSAAQYGTLVAGAGRMCVRARGAAVALAPNLAATLHHRHAPLCARINALLALTDICVRYASIVDPLLGQVCGCLAPDVPLELRRYTARSLTRLLLGGYLRLRPPLYYTYCALLADEDHDVSQPAEFYVTSCLTPDTIYHHFVDCIVHYNKENVLSFDSRQLIYDVMLQRLSMVQKLNVQCRIARDILEHAADMCEENDEDLPPDLNAALLDSITLLLGPRMKLPKKHNSGEPADLDELQQRVTTNIISHKMKRTVAEVTVPAVLRMHAHLRARGGQLLAYLVRLATDLLHDYRQEIEELIENDDEMVDRVMEFQENIGQAPSFGNAQNLVTSSAPSDPDTPRAPRRRPRVTPPFTPRKRSLKL